MKIGRAAVGIKSTRFIRGSRSVFGWDSNEENIVDNDYAKTRDFNEEPSFESNNFKRPSNSSNLAKLVESDVDLVTTLVTRELKDSTNFVKTYTITSTLVVRVE